MSITTKKIEELTMEVSMSLMKYHLFIEIGKPLIAQQQLKSAMNLLDQAYNLSLNLPDFTMVESVSFDKEMD